MIKPRSEKPASELEIDLTGPDGNAYSLLGYARTLARQLDLDWESVATDMTSGDYDHLVDVFEKYFGAYVTLYR